ncbi:L-seryl-tRNA(Sec) selenium transferase [Helicobacter bizzozeronii]|uniref:L-seryl-tRNA(Sec) selenium transferase n=1 Tax=Helicobacter bizzozeronii TaxID=56877 RepID=UPI0018F837A1|nr:L-seryl-tRNA(Sec) selenium transferase [Helicobacter bizzozeronii]
MEAPKHPPAMHTLLNAPCFVGYDRAILKALANALLEECRQNPCGYENLAQWCNALQARYTALLAPPFKKVYNATGVLLSTNLGRAPLESGALRELEILSGYVDLEVDLENAVRFERAFQAQNLLRALFNAPDALILNNNASALVLVASVFAPKSKRKQTLLSYGQLVEIGGGFRAHELLESVTHLKLVGSTNKTYLRDYKNACNDASALIASVHWSNFSMSGFVASVPSKSLFALAQERGLIFYEDLGSVQSVEHTQKALKSTHLLSFSADKLLGSVQAGIVLGRKEYIEPLRTHPLYRAFRVDKITLFLLTKSLQGYLQGQKTPLQTFLEQDKDALLNKALKLHRALSQIAGLKAFVIPTQAHIGGGVQMEGVESFGVQLQAHMDCKALYHALYKRGVAGVVRSDCVVLDVYALFEKDFSAIVRFVQEILSP